MRTEDIKISITTYDSFEEVPADYKELIEYAKKATDNAWAPYSLFKVGAALKLANGEIITANNQENAAFPSGLCAERTAVFYAGSQYPGVAIKALAVTAYSKGAFVEYPVAPCGGCRQVLLEYENRARESMDIIMYGTKEVKLIKSATDLLPLPFDYKLAI